MEQSVVKLDAVKAFVANTDDLNALMVAKVQVTAAQDALRKLGGKREGLHEAQNEMAECKVRIDRRMGEITSEMEKSPGGRPSQKTGSTVEPVKKKERMAEAGLTKATVSRNETIASLPAEEFEAHIEETKASGGEITQKGVLSHARAKKRQADKAFEEPKKPHKVAGDTPPFPDRHYDIVYADPPWEYYGGKHKNHSWVGHHYDLMTMEDIKALPVVDICKPDACLFLWGTAPKLVYAIETMQAWGFEYVTGMVWDKIDIGLGSWTRGRHEHLLIGRKGNFKAPKNKSLLEDSVIQHRRGRHSAKPARVAEMICRLFPDTERIELFARRTCEGFDVWGKEAYNDENTLF